MKQFKFILAAVLISFLTAVIAAERPSPAPFKIEVDLSGSQVKMRCKEGCNWVTTSYGCGASGSCTFVLDGEGVSGVAPR